MPAVAKRHDGSLDARESRFLQEYLIDLDHTRAARAAGFSEHQVSQARSWTTPTAKAKRHLFAALQVALDYRQKRAAITADRVLAEMSKMAFGNIADFMDLSGTMPRIDLSRATRDQLASLTEITTETVFESRGRGEEPAEVHRVKIKLADKRGPLKDLGQHHGLWQTKEPDKGTVIQNVIILPPNGREVNVEHRTIDAVPALPIPEEPANEGNRSSGDSSADWSDRGAIGNDEPDL